MTETTIFYEFLCKGGTAAALAAWNGVPRNRQIIVETDTGKFKIGDDATTYNALSYHDTDRTPEGVVNRYFTDERAQDAVAALFAAGSHSGVTFSYDDAGNRIGATITGAAPTTAITASEAIPANSAVNVYLSGGSPAVRLASKDDRAKPCNGWVVAAVALGAPAAVALGGLQVTGLSGLVPGSRAFLSTAGAVSGSAPTGTGVLNQPLGFASSASELYFNPSPTLIWTP